MNLRRMASPAAILTCLAMAVVVAVSAPARAEDRVAGMGFNLAMGPAAGSVLADGLQSPMFWFGPPNLELRLFPADHVSIDLLWDLPYMALALYPLGSGLYIQRTAVHFYTSAREPASLAIAPMLVTAIGRVFGEFSGAVGGGARIGVDLSSPGRMFSVGLYFRPSLQLWGTGDDLEPVLMALGEVTWTWYWFKD